MQLAKWVPQHEAAKTFADFKGHQTDRDAAYYTAYLRISGASFRRNINSRPADTLIAATAIYHGLAVYTINKKDFRQLGVTLFE
jgi:predicted nucleic acid-binding protein